jgi:predicted aldo/keto reductase-like oxidoreductase
MKLSEVDYYHLWTTHTREQFNAAMKPGSWYDGVMERKGQWKHLGITSHGDSESVISFLKSGTFEAVTIPFNVINTTRAAVVDYCEGKNIPVFAMNPLAGGFLAAHAGLKELALRFLLTFPHIRVLIGFTSVDEVKYAKRILDEKPGRPEDRERIRAKVDALIGADGPRCTACGYCAPCPQSINLGSCLSFYNVYRYMQVKQAKKTFLQNQWNDTLRLDRCTSCGLCRQRCPNRLPLEAVIKDAKELLYAK